MQAHYGGAYSSKEWLFFNQLTLKQHLRTARVTNSIAQKCLPAVQDIVQQAIGNKKSLSRLEIGRMDLIVSQRHNILYNIFLKYYLSKVYCAILCKASF